MNNKIIIAAVLVVFLGVLVLLFTTKQQKNMQQAKMTQDESAMVQQDVSMVDEKQATEAVMMDKGDTSDDMMSTSRYGEYASSGFDHAADKKRVLFFYASWCPTCIPADADFQANIDKIPDDVRLFRVNYNDNDTDASEKELARKYGITYQHTFVLVDSDGKEIKKWNGGQLDELLVNSK